MNIGIVGLGIVGSAVRHGFEKLGHRVTGHDIRDETRLEDVLESEIVYLCLPTPQGEDGHCDTSVIENVAAELLDDHGFSGIVAIK